MSAGEGRTPTSFGFFTVDTNFKVEMRENYDGLCLRFAIEPDEEGFNLEIVRLHGAPISVISDRDPRFTSGFWRRLQGTLGSKLNFNTTYHIQTCGHSERVIQILEDTLCSYVMEFGGS
ncbi:Integrase, catalytic core [Gossypium australe]|uniref:Integrase, catalytic core n=1 Tax=Gossypium australe TaxID=47621 RepID=A0A5B6X2F3_9ROSI|nr:Integrase, catalytic core [Gossypium australe]